MTQRIPLKNLPKGLMASMTTTEEYIHSLGFEQQLLSLIRYLVSQLNGCDYCLNMHRNEALKAGLSTDKLDLVGQWANNTTKFSTKEQAVLQWTQQLTFIHDAPLDNLAQLKARKEEKLNTAYQDLLAFFSQEEIANLSLVITQINAWNRLAKASGFEVIIDR